MSKISSILICTLLIISCSSNKPTVPVKEFTNKYFDLLKTTYPTAKVNIVDDRTIEVRFKDNAAVISVDNAYKAYQAEPDSLEVILSRYLNVYTSSLNQFDEKITVDKIVPTIKSVSYLESIRETAIKAGGTGDLSCVYEKYNDQLIIAYAIDLKSSVRALTHNDVKSFSLNEDSIKSIAIRNLDSRLKIVKREGYNGVYMLTAGGTYEASLILFNHAFTKDSIPVDGDFVIAIPNRDVLLITGSENKTGIAKVNAIAQKSFAGGSHPISPLLYKWNGKIFEKFDVQ
jgi:uncharacterized protein YtpQ (UPF0354 family)